MALPADQRQAPKIYFGRHLFGLSAILFGILTLVWRDFDLWQPFPSLNHIALLVYLAAAIQILGGVALLWPGTGRLGAAAFGGVSVVFALLSIPMIVAQPLVFNSWGNFFEIFSVVAGALVVYATAARGESPRKATLDRIGYFGFAVSVISFALEQAFYLPPTASLVPKWIPPGQMFWAIATTIAFALAAIALLSGRLALLASRLLTAMLLGFGLLVWLPALVSHPHSLGNWIEGAETLAMGAASWIVADFLSRYRSAPWGRLT